MRRWRLKRETRFTRWDDLEIENIDTKVERWRTDEITKAEVNKEKAGKDSIRFGKSVETNKTSLEDVEAELRELEKELGKCNALVEGLQEKVNRAQNAAENAKEDLDELKADLEEKQESIQKFRKREVSVAF